jgi:lipopolysaccharide transport system ATP-binding protein
MKLLSGLIKRVLSPREQIPLLMLDLVYPNPLSAFRYAEFTHYLKQIPGSVLLSDVPDFEQHHAFLASKHPLLAPRVRRFDAETMLPAARLVYAVFLGTTDFFLPHIEALGLPLVMTLYPGAGFGLDNPQTDAMLTRMFAYERLRKVIVTQTETLDYLKAKGFYDKERVEMIYGVVIPEPYFGAALPKLRYAVDKPTLDICFVAFKYTPLGQDKGYDTFIAAAHALAQAIPEARFHVVGNFGPEEIDVSAIADVIFFHGVRLSDVLPAFYAQMDLIVCPNIAGRYSGGKIDGFPTAACVEASLCGVALMCSDVAGQNTYYADGTEICVIPPDRDAIVDSVLAYRGNPRALADLGERGRARSMLLFKPEVQLGSRMRILQDLMR